MSEILGLFFIIFGITFDLFGCIGLIRFPDVYTRMQASTKCVTLGTCGILFGVFLKFGFSAVGVKALLCIIFIWLTMPVSAHALIRGALKAKIKLWEKSICNEYQKDLESTK
ncbi:MAG: monovalent cation/H(+) antiporter subunit G [Candidatus Omnitrophica bacterium]|nr:monovalent cation/H(+) antiporter subunit G [Candidatus Omnitrophota bacterium]